MKKPIYQSADKVKVCKQDICVETQGDSARFIAGCVGFAFICIGVAALIKAAN